MTEAERVAEEYRLLDAIEAARARLDAMSPEEKAAMWAKQRESWVRGMTTPCEHGVLDFEQCGECRAPAIEAGAHREGEGK